MLKRRLVLVPLLILLATAARLYQLQTQSIWFDEGWSAYAAAQPTLYAASQADQTNPPLYYVLLNAAAQSFGTSEFALRYFSLLIGLLTIPLVYQLAIRIGQSERAGHWAAILAAISAPLWWASQEARMYTLLALLILIAAFAWHILIIRPTRAAWIGLWLSELALLYAHNTGPVAALWLNVVTLLVWIIQRRARRPDWRIWIGGQIAVGLLWLPYFVTRFVLLQAANSAITSAPQVNLALLAQLWAGLWIAPWAEAIGNVPALIVLALIALLVALALLTVALRRSRQLLWLLAHIIVLTVGLVAGLIVLGNDLHGRYLVMIVPLLVVVVGIELASVNRWALRALAAIPFVLLFIVDLIVAQNPIYQHDDARRMVQYYADHLRAGDSVIAWSYADRYDLAYYWDRLGVQAKRITLPEGADLTQVLPLLPTSGDVALNVWYTQRADYRGMMGCVLGSGTVDAPDQFTTYGMSTLVYRHPSLDLPQLQPADLTFSDSGATPVARVNSVGQVVASPADHALCLPINLTLLRPVNVDLKAALIVQNGLGWEIARADAIFATANERTSSALNTGDLLTAYPLIRLPYGAPAGDYNVYLRLYDETANPSGYTPPQSGATISGRDVLLGTWRASDADWTQVKRTTDLPNQPNLSISADLTLLADNNLSDGETLNNGSGVPLTLLWQGSAPLPNLELDDANGAWSVPIPAPATNHGMITLDWRSVRIPADAPDGSALLKLKGGQTLAHYTIQALPMITQAPPFDHKVGVTFPGVGQLVGYTISDPPFSANNPPQVTLIWQAGAEASSTDYTATVQLLDATGKVIAQNDAIPGGRATTGWRAGEYIVDTHSLSFNTNAASGSAKLIVALYDAQTNQRMHLADGSDSVTLATGIAVH